METHTVTNHQAIASQASMFHSTLSDGSTRQTQQAPSLSYSLWPQRQQIQVIMLFLFYSGAIFFVAKSETTSLGSSLSVTGSKILHWNETLMSDNGQFIVGFYHDQMMPSNAGYNLAIWYAKVPIITPLWMPSDTSTVLSNKATLSLSKEGELQLQDGISDPVWTSLTKSENVTTATISDFGNLVLLNKENEIVWQSFEYPKNTLLPNQNYSSSSNVTMHSWKDKNNYTQGQYSLKWSTLDKLEILYKSPYFVDSTPYWNYNISITTNIIITGVVLTSQGEFRSTIKPNMYNIIGKSNITGSNHLVRRITLDIDGNLRIYSWQIGTSTNWNIDWEAIIKTCNIYGLCGPFAVCVNGQCQCLKGFIFIDTNDKKKGCQRTRDLSLCSQKNNTDDLVLMPGDYPYGLDMNYYPNVSVKYCQKACLDSCQCQCATISYPTNANGNVQCWLKSSTLINGRFQNDRNTYLRMAPPSINKSNMQKLSYSAACLIIYIVGPFMVIFGLISFVFGWPYIFKWMKLYQLYKVEKKWEVSQGRILRFTYNEIQLITQNFNEKIGEGRYGSVYKGEIGQDDAKVVVAVKEVYKLDQNVEAFITEVDVIGSIRHIHLIQVLGYCANANHKILVYEYMENFSLDISLFRANKSMPILEWRSRFNIAIQTAKGLAYLHNDIPNQCIIHSDVKPGNILIDSTYSAKISDFGLSYILNRLQPLKLPTHMLGTSGYVAPEETSNHVPITSKSDVYSFGMVLFEIISGCQISNSSSTSSNKFETDSWNFPMWAYSKLYESNFDILQVLDPSLTGIAEYKEVERVLKVAFWCIHNNHQLRPSMSEVVQMLEGHVLIALPIPQPNFKNKFLLDS